MQSSSHAWEYSKFILLAEHFAQCTKCSALSFEVMGGYHMMKLHVSSTDVERFCRETFVSSMKRVNNITSNKYSVLDIWYSFLLSSLNLQQVRIVFTLTFWHVYKLDMNFLLTFNQFEVTNFTFVSNNIKIWSSCSNVKIHNGIVCFITPYNLVGWYQFFRGMYLPHPQKMRQNCEEK